MQQKKKNMQDFIKFDYTIDNLSGRIKYIEELINSERDEYGRNYFEAYFDENYKVNLDSTKSLSNKVLACRALESMVDYILRSEEIRLARKQGDVVYKFYVNKEEFKNRVSKEILTRDIAQSSENIDAIEDNVIHFLMKKGTNNNKKERCQRIFSSDFVGEEDVNRILREYRDILDKVVYYIRNLDQSPLKRKQLTTMKKTIADDMLYTKTALRGTFGEHLKNELVESTEPSWDAFDYCNAEHIKHALRVQRDLDNMDDLAHIVLDMQITLKKLYQAGIVTEQQYRVVKLIQEGYRNKDIIEVVGINNSRVVHILSAVATKIANHYKGLYQGEK